MLSGQARKFANGASPWIGASPCVRNRGKPVNRQPGQARGLAIGASTCITPENGEEHIDYGPARGAAKARATRRQEQRGRAAMRPVLAGEEHRPPAARLQQRPHRLGRHVDVDDVVEPAGSGHADETHKCETTEAPRGIMCCQGGGRTRTGTTRSTAAAPGAGRAGGSCSSRPPRCPRAPRPPASQTERRPPRGPLRRRGGVVVHRKMRGVRGQMRVLAAG